MKKFIILLLVFFTAISCNTKKSEVKEEGKKEANPLKQSFKDYRELTFLEGYNKVSDTSFSEGGDATHRITELKNKFETLILFNQITRDKDSNELYSIIDTLKITQLNDNTYVTIGYCDFEDYTSEEIIAVVEKTENDSIDTILKAWRANPEKGKIEKIKDLEKVKCLNEFSNLDHERSDL